MFSIKRLVAFEQDWSIGLLIALVLVIVVMLIIQSMVNNKKFSPLSYVIGAGMAFALSYQMSLMVGAITLLNDNYDISNFIGLFSSQLADSLDSVSEEHFGWYIFRRILWSLLFMGIGGILVKITMQSKRRGGSSFVDYDSNVSGGTNDWGF